MNIRATITITSGPDRGKIFEIDEELTHLGKGPENHLILSDPLMTNRQATIVNRNGRYAIYTPLDHTIEVDGNVIPSERWVWLPTTARVRVSDYTSFQFLLESSGEEGGHVAAPPPMTPTPAVPPAPPQRMPPSVKKGELRKGEKKKKEQVAQFITDASGDTLVKLGQDGHLPELHLEEEVARRRTQKKQASSGGSPVLYLLVGFSLLSSVVMLFMDMGPSQASQEARTQARLEIRRDYFPRPGEKTRPYQEYLQQASFAKDRGDRAAELRAYQKVLDLYYAEDKEHFNGLSGSPERDQRLHELINIIIGK